MIAASALLFYEAARESLLRMAGGALVGVLFVAWVSRRLAERKGVHFEALAGADARRALLIVGVMTVHLFAEGIGVGVSFGGGESLGLVTAIAIATSRSLPSQPCSSSHSSTAWYLSDSASPAARCCGWSPPQVVPDALATSSRHAVALTLAGSTAAMLALEALLLT